MRVCKFLKLSNCYYDMSNILVAMCAHGDLFASCVFRLTLSLADVAPRLKSVEENMQEYFKVSLWPLSC